MLKTVFLLETSVLRLPAHRPVPEDPNRWQHFTSLCMIRYDMIYLLTAVGLTPGGSSEAHIYTQTVHRTTQ